MPLIIEIGNIDAPAPNREVIEIGNIDPNREVIEIGNIDAPKRSHRNRQYRCP